MHPDVRRMLLTMKAFAEGNRAMVYFTAKQVDIVKYGVDEEEKKKADALLAFMTPIAKAFMTEVGFEAANHGVQIYGGHGFIAEWGWSRTCATAVSRCCTKAPPASRPSTCWAVKC